MPASASSSKVSAPRRLVRRHIDRRDLRALAHEDVDHRVEVARGVEGDDDRALLAGVEGVPDGGAHGRARRGLVGLQPRLDRGAAHVRGQRAERLSRRASVVRQEAPPEPGTQPRLPIPLQRRGRRTCGTPSCTPRSGLLRPEHQIDCVSMRVVPADRRALDDALEQRDRRARRAAPRPARRRRCGARRRPARRATFPRERRSAPGRVAAQGGGGEHGVAAQERDRVVAGGDAACSRRENASGRWARSVKARTISHSLRVSSVGAAPRRTSASSSRRRAQSTRRRLSGSTRESASSSSPW